MRAVEAPPVSNHGSAAPLYPQAGEGEAPLAPQVWGEDGVQREQGKACPYGGKRSEGFKPLAPQPITSSSQNWGAGGAALPRLLFFLLLTLTLPAHARPQVLVVVADHLTLADVLHSPAPGFALLRRQGQLALMSPGLPEGTDPAANVYASLGAGDSIRVGDTSQGLLGRALAGRVKTSLVGNADGDDIGPYRPASFLLPLPDFAPTQDGTVPAPTFPGGRRIDPMPLWTATQDALRVSSLVIVHDGDFLRVEREHQRGLLTETAYALHRQAALAALGRYLQLALSGPRRNETMFFVVPTAPLNARGTWDSLTPFVRVPPVPPPDKPLETTLLRSDTTQTAGLVAARDVAPTILSALGLPASMTMTGAAMEAIRAPAGDAALRHLDTVTRLNQQAQNPFFWTLGLGGAAALFLSLALYARGVLVRSEWARRVARYALRLLSAWPLALLLAPCLSVSTLPGYLSVMVALTGGLALLVPSPEALFAMTAVVLVGDGLTGTHLVSQSLLSAYALSGIRFYGIGNEYMGLLLGGALWQAAGLVVQTALTPHQEALRAALTPPADGRPSPASQARVGEKTPASQARVGEKTPASQARVGEKTPAGAGEGRKHTSPNPRPCQRERVARGFATRRVRASSAFATRRVRAVSALLWFLLVAFALSFPAFGAKGGGAVTATALFVVAWRLLQKRPVGWGWRLGSIGAGFALALLWGILTQWLPVRHTHLQTATEALGQGRLGYIAGVAWRKIGLALQVTLHPGTLLGLLGLVLLAGAARVWLRRPVTELLLRRPGWKAVLQAGGWGCMVCVLVNDSGIVAAILLALCLTLPVLHALYGET